MRNVRNIMTIFGRELKSYFEAPVAYVFMIVFLLMIGALTFKWPWAPLYEMGIADLSPFFMWIPIVYLLLVPAATMGLWAEERRSGTIELLLTMPITMTQAIIGKFLAAWCFIVLSLLMTFPVIITVSILGDPEGGVILCGYIGAILLAGAYVAVGMFTSAMSKSQVISFVLSLIICFALLMAGTDFILGFFGKWAPDWLVQGINSISFWSRFDAIKRGVLDLSDIMYYLSVMGFMIFGTHLVIDNRKTA